MTRDIDPFRRDPFGEADADSWLRIVSGQLNGVAKLLDIIRAIALLTFAANAALLAFLIYKL